MISNYQETLKQLVTKLVSIYPLVEGMENKFKVVDIIESTMDLVSSSNRNHLALVSRARHLVLESMPYNTTH